MVIHCGDEANHSNPAMNFHESLAFFDWYSNLPISHKVFIPGNHSTAIQAGLLLPSQFPSIHFLIHQSTVIEGINIFGSPYTPSYGESWAYMKKRNRMQQVWESLPSCDILITHGPPKGILDITTDKDSGELLQVGCKSLFNQVQQITPHIHAFGHLHDEPKIHNFGTYTRGGTKFINCSCVRNGDSNMNGGTVIEI